MELSLFDEVADSVRGMAPAGLGVFHERAHRYGVKVWFGADAPPKEHYEAQVVGPKDVKGARVLAIEVGFHAEYPKEPENEAVIEHLLSNEKRWRRALGADAEVGPFLGRRNDWRRVSETWLDPDLEDGGLVMEIAARLTDYINALEPVLQARRRA